MARKKSDEGTVFQLKVTLAGSKPPIWRRIQVRGSVSLGDLHNIVQGAMGWYNSHLHQFVVNDRYYGMPDREWAPEVIDEDRVRLDDLVSREKDRIVYEYDFGDGWNHKIVVEKVLIPEQGVHYPVCLTGKRACPPEDVGGIWGYYNFLEAIQDPSHPEHEEMLWWIGGSFDPDEVSLDSINQRLR